MIPTPVNSVAIPPVYFDLCRGWYDGMDILYAVASTGSLTMGTIRPALVRVAGRLRPDLQG